VILTLVQNIALLVALSVVHQWIVRRWRDWTAARQVASGVLFGAITVVGMMTPFHAATGIQYDGRSIIVAVAGVFGGPIVAVVAGVIAAAYRLWLGGAGAFAGVSVIVESAALGVAYYYLRRGYPAVTRWLPLYGLAVTVHAVMPPCSTRFWEAPGRRSSLRSGSPCWSSTRSACCSSAV
jgi:LytS/YehU family sensor histidine kinase